MLIADLVVLQRQSGLGSTGLFSCRAGCCHLSVSLLPTCLLPRTTSEQIKVGGSVQSATEVSPYKRSGNTLSYGPYSDAAPWAAEQISGAWGCVGCQACLFRFTLA